MEFSAQLRINAYDPNIREYVKKLAGRRKAAEIGRAVYEDSSLGWKSKESAAQFVSEMMNGCIYGSPSTEASGRPLNCQRAARVLHEIGVPEDHEIVQRLRKAHPGVFDYPPKSVAEEGDRGKLVDRLG